MNMQEQQPLPPTPPSAPLPPPQASPAPTSPVPMRRAPGLAVVLSLLPGLGHVYLGLYQRGIAFFIAAATAIWLGDRANIEPFLGFFVWGFAMIDAYRQAQFINTGMLPETVPAATPGRKRGSLGFGVFLTLLGVLLLYNQFYPLDLTFLTDWWPLILVAAGIYLLARHFVESKRQGEPEPPPERF